MKHYFTFGQNHVHRVNDKTFDCDSVVEIEADDPVQAREIMVLHFGQKWAFQYPTLEKLKLDYYPRGVIELCDVETR